MKLKLEAKKTRSNMSHTRYEKTPMFNPLIIHNSCTTVYLPVGKIMLYVDAQKNGGPKGSLYTRTGNIFLDAPAPASGV